MGATLRTIRREIERYGSHKILPLITVVIPVIMALLFTVMFSQGVMRTLPIAICDQDMTSTSRQLATMLQQKGSLKVALATSSVEEAERLMASKDVVAVVYIPKDFEKGVMSASGTEVKAVVDGVFLSRASIAYKELVTVLQALNIGVETKFLSAKGIPEATASQLSYPVVMDQHVLFNPYANYAFFLLPGLLPIVIVVSLLFGTIYAIGSEFRYGTADEWLNNADGDIWKAICGKLLVYFLIYQIEFVFFNTIVFRYLGLHGSFMEIALIEAGGVMMILTYMMVGLAFVAILQSMRLALSIATFYGVAAFSFSGLAFPTMAMPMAIQVVGFAFPFYYYMRLFIDYAMRNNTDPVPAFQAFGMFIVFMVIMLLTVPLLKKNCLDRRTYGKL